MCVCVCVCVCVCKDDIKAYSTPVHLYEVERSILVYTDSRPRSFQ